MPIKNDYSFADEIASLAKKQIDVSAKFKQPRMVEVLDNEDVYNYKLKPALKGRINIPFDGVVMTGFIDTLVAQVNRPPKIEFIDPTGANLKGARKVTAAFEQDRKRMRLDAKDRSLKKLAALSGRGIAKYYAESDPTYCPYFDVVDYLDFQCEPNGGGHLDYHYFSYQENIFRTKESLIEGGKSGWYNNEQVQKVINYQDPGETKKNEDVFQNKYTRYSALGLDMQSNNFVGGQLYNLTEGQTLYEGVRYHVIFDSFTGIWLRCVLLKDDFGNDKTPFLSFASPQEDAFNFWNRGPADEIKPIAEGIRVNLNEVMNNNRKRNWDMKAVDQNMITNIKEFDWKQDGIVQLNVPMGQSIQNGIYSFQTPEISGALNLNTYLNNLAGEKLGVSSQTQGQGSEQLLGIYQGNQLQISKRMKLISDSYEEFYADLGTRYDWGLWDHANDDMLVKLISTDGVGWEKITKEDKDPDYVVSVTSSSMEMAEDENTKKTKMEIILSFDRNQAQSQLINQKAIVEEKLRLVGFDDEKIKKIMDTKADATDELLSEAKKAIEMILEGRDPGINRSATTGYLQYVSDWILNNADDLNPKQMAELNAYFDRHVPIATQNAEKKQFNDELAMGAGAVPSDGKATPTGTIIPPSGTTTPTIPPTMTPPAPPTA